MNESRINYQPDPETEPQDSLWQQMVTDLHVIMKHQVNDAERQAWRAEKEKNKPKLDFSGFIKPQLGDFNITFDHKTYLRMRLLALRMEFSKLYVFGRKFNLTITTGDPHPRCTWIRAEDSSDVNFDIFVNQTDHPHAQEELLHAAQEILFGNDNGMSFSTAKTSEQLVHTSFLLDMALSFAALEEGTWQKWHQKADELQQKERQHFVKTQAWDYTLLGKNLNKRFQYNNMSLADVGVFWKNLSIYFKDMFNNVGGITNHEMVEVFEFGCLAYGTLHRDLSYSMVDLPIGDHLTDEEAGRVVVDWAKRVLKHFSGTEHETELLGHHSDVREIPEHYFNYEVPQSSLQILMNATSHPNRTLAQEITVSTLRIISLSNWGTKMDEMMIAWEKFQANHNNESFERVLTENGVSRKVFDQLVMLAEVDYRKQYQDTPKLIKPRHERYEFKPLDLSKFSKLID